MTRISKSLLLAGLFIAFLIANSTGAVTHSVQSVTEDDVYSYINSTLSIELQVKKILIQAFKKGFSDGRITPYRASKFLEQVHRSGAAYDARERILLIFAKTLLANLPVKETLNKFFQGLQGGKSFSVIGDFLDGWQAVLKDVRNLLERKGIKAGAKLLPQDEPSSLRMMDLLIEEIADALDQYVRKGKNPQDKQLIKSEVITRLNKNKAISPYLVKLVDNRINDEELSQIALAISERTASSRYKV